MTEQSILLKLQSLLSNALQHNVGAVSLNANIRTDLGLDSLRMLYMIIAMEEEFQIVFDLTKLANIKTIQDLVMYIYNEQHTAIK